MEPVKALFRFIREATGMARRVHRWTHYPELPEAERETVETHELATVWLGAAMLAIEREAGTHKLNESRILLACSIHDTGEGKMGDIGFSIKNDPRVRTLLQTIEREYVEEQFHGFPDIVRSMFLDAYAVESERGSTLEGDFFEAIERVGYMTFAVPQVKKGRLSFLVVFENQHEAILRLSGEFESVRRLYEPYREYVAGKLQEVKDLARVSDDD